MKSNSSFWNQHPALLYALAVLLGFYAFFYHPAVLVLVLFFGNRRIIALTLMAAAFLFASTHYRWPTSETDGWGQLEISALSLKQQPFGTQWSYRGTLKSINGFRNIPCTVTLPNKKNLKRPPADQAYWVKGRLRRTEWGNYYFSVDKNEPWHPIQNSKSFAEWRYQLKKKVKKYVRTHIPDPQASSFLAGLATGEFDDPVMQHEFSRFGLLHLMAISGFHFAIIAAILSGLFRLVIPKKQATILLIFLLSSYFLFLGESPSIMRAWMTILVAMVGSFWNKQSFGLNSVGIAILGILLWDPAMSRTLGFKFSVITTVAILLFYPIFSAKIRSRSLSEVSRMTFFDQHGYLVLQTFKKAAALALAVNLVAIPMMLFYFQQFPLLSLIYNLFYPFMVSLSMLLLIVGTMLGPLGAPIHALNAMYTHFTLNFVFNMPNTVDVVWAVKPFPALILLIYVCAVFQAGIYLRGRERERMDLAFA